MHSIVEYVTRQLTPSEFPPLLAEIPEPPAELWCAGNLPPEELTLLSVVGSRAATGYGQAAAKTLIEGLRGAPIGIVSGLALGIDGVAHQAAIDAGLYTLAIPGSGLAPEALYPRMHQKLAQEILASGGGLLSEYEPNFRATKWSFPKRNRLMAGIAHATLVIEASERSGTLITARLALDYNRDVFALPGPITNTNSAGPHRLIRDGAALIRAADDIREALSLPEPESQATARDLTENEQMVVAALHAEARSRDELSEALSLSITELSIALSTLELKGVVREERGVFIVQH